MFDIELFKNLNVENSRFESHLSRLKGRGLETICIEETVLNSLENIRGGVDSFVIYGEPQSGKTEMMISLTAKLLDEGFNIIIHLLNDNVKLLNQNLNRFREAAINPTPVNFAEVLEEDIGDRNWIIFSKKNNNDLTRLIDKLDGKKRKVIIDDEADYASPNGKVNKNEKTAINHSIHKLLGDDGVYIGVTATPARLDLNNTFENITENWVRFSPHSHYVGKDVFFPMSGEKREFGLKFLPEIGDDPKHLQKALLSFLVNVALINNEVGDKNYCFLVHTSGAKADHSVDHKIVLKLFDVLSNSADKNFQKMVEELYTTAIKKLNGNHDESVEIVQYVLRNIARRTVTILNSANKTDTDPTNPPSLFTVAIGGNIVSRGVTFKNLLGMFFTRDVKHKLQQDTYIQRARMFGDRREYLRYFELWIPKSLYKDWHRCFVYHHLSLESLKTNNRAPIWISDNRIQPAAQSSIDKRTVFIESGELLFDKFQWDSQLDNLSTHPEPLRMLNHVLGDKGFPTYILSFIKSMSSKPGDIALHRIRLVDPNTDYHDSLFRPRGALGGSDIKKYPQAIHHILIMKNTHNEGRIAYKYEGKIQTFVNRRGSN